MYIETSSPRKPGDKARLISEEFPPVGLLPRCVTFWYHMYGNTVGTLRLISKTGPGNQSETVIWELSGNFGDVWMNGQTPIHTGQWYSVSVRSTPS